MAKSRKIISIICCLALVLCLIVGLVACGPKNNSEVHTDPIEEQVDAIRQAAIQKALMADSYQNYAQTCDLNLTTYPELGSMGLKLITGCGDEGQPGFDKNTNNWRQIHEVETDDVAKLQQYFNPDAPTLILIHGVQFNEGRYGIATFQSDCRPTEIINNIDPNPAPYFAEAVGTYTGSIDMSKYYRDLGYNVMFFHYENFADPLNSDDFSSSLDAVDQVTNVIWCKDNCTATFLRNGQAVASDPANTFTNGKFCVAEFYVAEYLRWINAVKQAFPDKDFANTNAGITTAAHSMGGVVNVASNFLLSQVAEAGYMSVKLMPTRMMQMDPYVGMAEDHVIAWTGEKYLSNVECDTYATALEILVNKYNIGCVYACNNGFAVPCMMVFALWDPEKQVFTNHVGEVETNYSSFSYAINRILAVAPFVVLQAYYPYCGSSVIAGTECHNAMREWVLSTILYDAPTVTKDGKTYTVPTMKMSAADIKALGGHFFYQFRYVYDDDGNIVYEDDGTPEENTESTETIRCDDDTFILQK